MVGVIRRMRSLHARLVDIRLGTGALILPKEIKRLHLRFAIGLQGHLGSRKFWRNELVRLQYHNPAVLMTTDRTARLDEPATLSIHFAPAGAPQTSKSATSSAAPSDSKSDSAPTERVESIDMKHKQTSEILDELIKITNAYPVEPTAADLEEMKRVKEQQENSARDRAMMNEVKAKRQKEKDILAAARGVV